MAEIIGTVNYIADIPLYATVKPYSLSGETYVQTPRTNIQMEERNVKIRNIRGREDNFSYDKNSFRFVKFPTAVNWDGSQEKSVKYLEETRQFLLDEFKADRVICYDIRRRTAGPVISQPEAAPAENSYFGALVPAATLISAPPIRRVHVDHSFEGGFQRMYRHLTDQELEKYMSPGWRVRIANVWRPLRRIERCPLTVIDRQTVAMKDLIETDQVSSNYHGETFTLKYNPNHQFYWLESQSPEEIAVMINFDSYNGFPMKEFCCCAHTAFELPSTPAESPNRESVEIRAIVFNKI